MENLEHNFEGVKEISIDTKKEVVEEIQKRDQIIEFYKDISTWLKYFEEKGTQNFKWYFDVPIKWLDDTKKQIEEKMNKTVENIKASKHEQISMIKQL